MHFILKDSTGTIHQSDSATFEELVEELGSPAKVQMALVELKNLFKDFSKVNHFSMEIGGSTRYFNPAHIVYAEVVE